jgi:transcriptional regulator with XRE-family HTH domain
MIQAAPKSGDTTGVDMARKKLPATDFGSRLSAFRRERGMTQVELAEAIGANQPAISYYESNSGHPPAPVLADLARALDVSADALLGLDKERRPAKPTRKNEVPAELRSLWKQFQLVRGLSERDQRSVIRLIRALSAHDNPKRGAKEGTTGR